MVGIDIDEDVLAVAANDSSGGTWVLGDVLTYDFGCSFDLVASIAVVHHFPDLEAGLARLASREIATKVLPGVHWQQHPLWRYTLIWRKPAR